jgi:hypothetical protein
MQTHDNLFAKEFKDMMNGRRSMSISFKLVDLPLPMLESMINGTPKGHIAVLRGIKEPFFDRLNGEEVQLVGRTTLQKRQVLSDGTFRLNKDGKNEYTQVPVTHGCVAILSKTSIGLKRTVDGKEHKVSEGFRYVDYVDTTSGRKYIYVVPKTYAFRLNMCALVITPNKRRVYFKGCKLALQNGNYVYLYVIPFKYRETQDIRILGVKSDYSFDKEVSQIIQYWMSLGVIFDLKKTALADQVNGITNLGIMDLDGTVVSEDYRRFDISMADENEADFQASLGTDD